MSFLKIARPLAAVFLLIINQLSFAATIPTKPAITPYQNITDAELQGKRFLLAQMAKKDGGPMITIVAMPRDTSDGAEPIFRKLIDGMLTSGYHWVKDDKGLHSSIRCKAAVTSVPPKANGGAINMIDVSCDSKIAPESGLAGRIRIMRIVSFRGGVGIDVASVTGLIPGLVDEAFNEAVRLMPK